MPESLYAASPPVEATALIVDLRNFTPNLKAAASDHNGVNHFCHFLAEFYALCLETSLTALPRVQRDNPPMYMSSTGDGVLVIFYDADWHYGHGFLAALLLHHMLGRICREYNHQLPEGQVLTNFGIGVDSGTACRVQAKSPTQNGHPILDTFVGNCINVAARAQEVSKTLFKSHTVIAEGTYQHLSSAIGGASYHRLVKAVHPGLSDEERREIDDKLNDLAGRLCLSFIHLHQLKGVDRPTSLFRLAESRARTGYSKFDHLLNELVRNDPDHLKEVLELLTDR